MEMKVAKLREALKLVQPVIPKKPTLVVLKSVLLGDGKVVATNLDTTVLVDLPEADTKCLIPHRSVLELLKYVPGDETLCIKVKKRIIHLAWDSGSATYDILDADEYPPIPTVEAKVEAAVDGDLLVKALASVIGYCATETTRPVLTGVAVSIGEDVQIAGADGFRLAYQTLPISFPVQETVIIPADGVRILELLWDKSPSALPPGDSLISQIVGKRKIDLALDSGFISAHFGRIDLFIKLIQGTPPDYRKVIPTETPLRVQVFGGDLERALRRVKDVASDAKGIVRLSWDDTTMTITAKSQDKGRVEAKIPIQAEGGKGKTAIEINYLLDYLKGKDGAIVISLENEKSPVLLKYGRTVTVVMMPCFVEW